MFSDDRRAEDNRLMFRAPKSHGPVVNHGCATVACYRVEVLDVRAKRGGPSSTQLCQRRLDTRS